MQIKKIYQEIESDFSLKTACEWDYCGHQYGNKKYFVKKIMVSLDLTSEVIFAAIIKKVNFIIIHHPFYFGDKKNIKLTSYKQKIIKLLLKYKITVYVLHTNYDALMNKLILQKLNSQKIRNFLGDNLIKIGDINLTAYKIIIKLKKIFKISIVQYNLFNIKKKINTVAILAGSAGNIIEKLKKDIDIFITGEIKWDQWILANEKKISVICFNHYMEDFFTDSFSKYLIKKFPNLIIIPYHIKNIISYF